MKSKIYGIILLTLLQISLTSAISIDGFVDSIRNRLVDTALQFEGVTYKGGGTDKYGMDCSGLIITVFASQGIELPRTSYDQSEVGKEVSLDDVRIGDLLFFNNNESRDVINHVGMVVEIDDDEIRFIHTSSSRGVMISSMLEPYHYNSFVKAKTVIE